MHVSCHNESPTAPRPALPSVLYCFAAVCVAAHVPHAACAHARVLHALVPMRWSCWCACVLVQNVRGSVGVPTPGTTLKVVDPVTFEPVPDGAQVRLLCT